MSLGHLSHVEKAGSSALKNKSEFRTFSFWCGGSGQATTSHNRETIIKVPDVDIIENYDVDDTCDDSVASANNNDGDVLECFGCIPFLHRQSSKEKPAKETFEVYVDIFADQTTLTPSTLSSTNVDNMQQRAFVIRSTISSTCVDAKIDSCDDTTDTPITLQNIVTSLELSPLDLLYQGTTLVVTVCYPTTLDIDLLLASLKKALIYYPVLCGRLSASGKSVHLVNAGVPVEVCNVAGSILTSVSPKCHIFRASLPVSHSQPKDARTHFMAALKPTRDYLSDTEFSSVPLMAVKITLFDSGGTVLAIDVQRCMCDSEATLAFMVNWSRLYRGIDIDKSIDEDIHNRRFSRFYGSTDDDAKVVCENDMVTVVSHREKFTPEHADILIKMPSDITVVVPITSTKLQEWTKMVTAALGDVQSISTDEILTAHVWKIMCTIHCLQVDIMSELNKSMTTVCLRSLDIRKRLLPPLCPGYFGNAVCPISTAMSVDSLHSKSVSEVALLLRSSANEWTNRKITSFLGWLEETQKYGSKTYIKKNNAKGLVFSVNSMWRQTSGQNWDDIEFDCKPMSYDYGSQSSSTVCDVTSRPDHDGVNIWYSGSPEAVGMFDRLIHDFY